MKLLLTLLFCLGISLARAQEWSWLSKDTPSKQPDAKSIDDTEFRPDREYHYLYNGQIAAGIPDSSKQHSGTRVQAMVKLVFKTASMCLMKITTVRMGKVNSDLTNPSNIAPFDSFEEVKIEQQQKEILMLPIKFNYVGGLISKIALDGGDQPWSANIKRGILNMINVNLKRDNALDAVDPRSGNVESTDEYEDSAFYRVMEETIEGECETLYTVTKQPGEPSQKLETLNVTKSINFEKCKKRPLIKYNFRFSDPCPTCESKYNEDEKFVKSSTVAYYNITGTTSRFMIDGARVESQYTFVPFNEESNLIVTYVNQTLVLVKSGPVSAPVEELKNQQKSDSSIGYSLDWDIAKEQFNMEGDANVDGSQLFATIPNKVDVVGSLLQKLVGNMREQVQDDASNYFDSLIQLFRTVTKAELTQIHDKYFKGEQFHEDGQNEVRDIWPNVVALCGTKVCVQHLVERIRSDEYSTLDSVMALKDLINIQTPSKEIIEELLKLSESETVQSNFALKQTTWLTVGSLMNALCSNTADKWARDVKDSSEKFCPRQLKEKYVKLIMDKFQQTNKWEEGVTYLKAMGNAGLDLSIFELEKVLRNNVNPYSTLIKTEAVLAMRQLKTIMPKKIQKVLMPILLNQLESPTLRIACSYMILETMPERPVLDQIARIAHNERSQQVASFVHSYMNTLANSTNPCEKKLSRELRLALRLSRPINAKPLGYSKIVRIPAHSPHHKVGLDLDLASSYSNTSFIPRYLTASLHANFLGFWNKYLVTFGAIGEGLESVIRSFYKDHSVFADQSSDETYASGPQATSDNDYSSELHNIFSSLNILGRDDKDSEVEPKALLYMKFKDQDYGFLPIKEAMINSYLKNNFNLREIETKVRRGISINFNKATMLHEMTYKIPTTIGMPMTVTIKVPLVLSARGKLQGMSNTERSLKSFKIQASLKPSLVANLIVDIECWSPIVSHGLKVLNKIKIFQPIDAKLEVDLQSQSKSVKIHVRPPTTRQNLITLESRPITYTRVWSQFLATFGEPEERTVIGENVNQIHKFNKCAGGKSLAVEMCLRGRVQKTLAGSQFFPLSGPNKIVLTVEPGKDAPRELTIKLSGKFLQKSAESFSPKMFNDEESFKSNNDNDYEIRNRGYKSRFDESKYGNSRFDEIERNQRFGKINQRRDQSDEWVETGFRFNDENLRETRERSTSGSVWDESDDGNSRFDENERNQRFGEGNQRRQQSDEWNEDGFRFNERNQQRGQDRRYSVKNSLASNIRIEVESNSRKFVFDANHFYDSARRSGKLNAKLASSASSEDEQPFMICLESQSLFSNAAMVSDDNVLTSARLTWGRTCESKNFISLKHKSSKSQMQRSRESEFENCQDESWCSPVSQNKYLNPESESDLPKYNIDIDYSNVPIKWQNYTNKAFIMLKHHFYASADVAQVMVRNPENKVRAMINIDPHNKQFMTVTIKTPKENTTISQIPTPFFLQPMNNKQCCAESLLDEDTVTATCSVSSRKVSTFDKVEYSIPLSTCYAILAKDCSEKPRFVVMMRKIGDNSDLKEIKIVTASHKILLAATTADGKIKCTINDRQYGLNEEVVLTERNSPILRVSKVGLKMIKVELSAMGLVATFDGQVANIEILHVYQNEQCGLCGHLSPDHRVTDNVREQYEQYILKGGNNCRQTADHPDSDFTYKPYWEPSDETTSDQERLTGDKPRLKQKLIETQDQICISVDTVPQCPANTYSMDKVEKRVPYYCLKLNDGRAWEYRSKIQYGETVHMDDVTPTMTRTEYVPTKCEPIH